MNTKYKLACKIEFGDMIGQLLIWLILCIITFGLASLFFPYYFAKLILNNTEIQEIQNNRVEQAA